MKDCRYVWHLKVLLFLVSILLLSSCDKLNMLSWISPKKNTVSETAGFDWPRWRGPDQNGVSKETEWNPKALANGPNVVWKVNVGMGLSNVAIKGDYLYTMGYDVDTDEDVVYCIRVSNGKHVWRYTYPCKLARWGNGTQTTPTISGEHVYTLSVQGDLLCIDAKRGKLRWRKNIVEDYQVTAPFYGFAGSPVIVGDVIILAVNTAGMALDKETGEKIWISEKPPQQKYNRLNTSTGVDYATPVVYEYNGKRYAALSSYKGQYSIDVETGKQLWFYDCPNPDFSRVTDPLIFDNSVFLIQYSNGNIGSVLLDIVTGDPKVVWTNKNMWSEISSPVTIDGYIYVCHGGPEEYYGSLCCLDSGTGKLMWGDPLKERYTEKPISLTAANGKLIVLNAKGTLSIAEATPSAYKEISRGTIPEQKGFEAWWTPPVLCGGRIYCRSSFGDLVCIDVSK